MEEQKIIQEIHTSMEEVGVMNTIGKYFGVGAKIRLPFTLTACDTIIEELNLSVRSYNALKRAGLDTVDKVVDAMQENKLWGIRSLGKNSRAEIHVTIYEFGYKTLPDRERKAFAKTLYELNKERLA